MSRRTENRGTLAQEEMLGEEQWGHIFMWQELSKLCSLNRPSNGHVGGATHLRGTCQEVKQATLLTTFNNLGSTPPLFASSWRDFAKDECNPAPHDFTPIIAIAKIGVILSGGFFSL